MHFMPTGCYGNVLQKLNLKENKCVLVTLSAAYLIHWGLFTQHHSYITLNGWPGHDRTSSCSVQPQIFPPLSASRWCCTYAAQALVLCDLNAYSLISRLWHIYHEPLSGAVPLGWSGQHGRARHWCSVTDETHFGCNSCAATQFLWTDLK